MFADDNLELKIGYLNINDLTAEYHVEYINADRNLRRLDLLALADTRLGAEQKQGFCDEKLNNFNVLKRFDVDDGSKHMGMLLLQPRHSTFVNQIPVDLIDCFEDSKIVKSGKNMGKKETYVQGNILWIKEHYIKICFLYFREKPTQQEILKTSKIWKDCDLLMGDFNLKPNIASDKKLLNFICGTTYQLALNEDTTVHGQPDHVILHKRFESKSYATSFFNFISDHKSAVIRIGLMQNTFDPTFVEKKNFNAEKHLKKLKSKVEHSNLSSQFKMKSTIVEDLTHFENEEPTEDSIVNIDKLHGSNWLDDTVINEYGKILQEQFKDTIIVFETHFLEQLTRHGYKGVRRWAKNVNIFDKQLVFYPMFENYHWFLAVQNNDERKMTMFEPYVPLDEVRHPPKLRKFNPSLRQMKSSKLDMITKKHMERLSLVHNEFVMKNEKLPTGLTFKQIVLCAPDIPHQSNSYDCGVFLLQFMKYLTMQEPFNFTCLDMPYFRQEIKEAIENKKVQRTLESNLVKITAQNLSQPENTEKKSTSKKRVSMDDQQKCNQKKERKQRNNFPQQKCTLEKNNCKILKFVNPSRKNLCFSNAVTTVLFSIPQINQMLQNENQKMTSNNKILNELNQLYRAQNFSTESTLKLRTIVHEECMIHGQSMRTFNDSNQHDAAEFFNSLLEHLFKSDPEDLNTREKIFGGISQKTMFCSNTKCNKSEQLQLETISEIIPLEFSGFTLESCLEQFFSPEEIERHCEHCGTKKATQVVTFVREPETLILQLNRFRFSQFDDKVVKIHEPLIFPTEIRLPSGTSYKIVATINHQGESANVGHYTSLVMNQMTGGFILVDDSSVFPSITINEETLQQVYILVYIRKH